MFRVTSSEGHAPGTLHLESGAGLEEKLGKTEEMLQFRRVKVVVSCWVIVSEVGTGEREACLEWKRLCLNEWLRENQRNEMWKPIE